MNVATSMSTLFFSGLLDNSKPSLFLVIFETACYKIRFCTTTKEESLLYLNTQMHDLIEQGFSNNEAVDLSDGMLRIKVGFSRRREKMQIKIFEMTRIKEFEKRTPPLASRPYVFMCKIKLADETIRYGYTPFYKDIDKAKELVIADAAQNTKYSSYYCFQRDTKCLFRITDKTSGKIKSYAHDPILGSAPGDTHPHFSFTRIGLGKDSKYESLFKN